MQMWYPIRFDKFLKKHFFNFLTSLEIASLETVAARASPEFTLSYTYEKWSAANALDRGPVR
jgi:hypothetical protein